MARLYLDFETRSTCDIKAGVYRYFEDPSTQILLAAWAIDDGPVQWSPLPGMPGALLGTGYIDDLFGALTAPDVTIVAHNAAFERIALRSLGVDIPLTRWDCTAARAARQALPRSLEGALQALDRPVQKDTEGRALMMRMCKPRKPRKGEDPNGTYWFEDPDRIERLGAYCATDVVGTRDLDEILAPLPEWEREVWRLTERMNDRGVPVDVTFANRARWITHDVVHQLDQKVKRLTDGAVPKTSNTAALRRWLWERYGVEVLEGEDDSVDKAALTKLVSDETVPELAREVIACRLEAAKSSVAKYQSIIDRVNADGRVRGNLVYHGASTGRWAGSGVQMQNFPRAVVKDFYAVFDAAALADGAEFMRRFPAPMETLSHSLRPTICTKPYRTLWWIDYASVEARGVAWLAGASKLTELFRTGGKIYEEMASVIYGVPVSEIGKDSRERFVGKQIVLGGGYGLGAAKFVTMCEGFGVDVGMDLAERAVRAYREDNPEIPALWKGLERACIQAIDNPGTAFAYRQIAFRVDGRWLKMRLPDGTVLYYRNPRLKYEDGPYGERARIVYDAVNPKTRQWGPESTWGGKLTENAVQSICRQIIAKGLLRLERRGVAPILTVHDEGVFETDLEGETTLTFDEAVEIFCQLDAWARDFPLAAEGKDGVRYGK